MPRYIDADAVIKEIEQGQDSLKTNNDAMWEINKKYYKGLCWAHRIIDDQPTADVVPRERFDRVFGNLKAVLEERSEDKAEVAREIFEEIEREITDALKSNYKVLPQVEESEALWNNVNGKINALRGIGYFIEELKERYTETEPPEGD
jgi:hypothetical protein